MNTCQCCGNVIKEHPYQASRLSVWRMQDKFHKQNRFRFVLARIRDGFDKKGKAKAA